MTTLPALPFELCDDDCGVRWREHRLFDRNFRGPIDPETHCHPWPKQTAQSKARYHYNMLCAAWYDGRANGIAMPRAAAAELKQAAE